MENKQLIIKKDNEKHQLMINSINQFKALQDELKRLKDMEKILKDTFKQYDFEKVVILDEKDGNVTFQVTKYHQTRKELDIDKMISLIVAHVCGDLNLVDGIVGGSQQLEDDIKEIVEHCYNEKKVECVKFTVK